MHLEEYVRPFRISKVLLKADSVLELPPHTIYRSGTQVGDKLEIALLAPAAMKPTSQLISSGRNGGNQQLTAK